MFARRRQSIGEARIARPIPKMVVLILIGFAILVTGAWRAAANRFAIGAESRVWFEGTSTVRAFSCDAPELLGVVSGRPTTPDADLDAVGRSVEVVEIDIPVAALDCRNGTMNEHMWKALKATEHPVIRYRLTRHEVASKPGGELAVSMTGLLTIAGQTNPVTLTADAVEAERGGPYRITGRTEIRMTNYGVKPPSLMLGTMKVRDPVVIHFDVALRPQQSVAGAAAPASGAGMR